MNFRLVKIFNKSKVFSKRLGKDDRKEGLLKTLKIVEDKKEKQ